MQIPFASAEFELQPYTVHIWYKYVNEDAPADWYSLLNHDEKQRADRFHFPVHRNRFIVARANLRLLLSHYENISPKYIEFSYNEFGKPFLLDTFLQFNVSHSHELIVYAFTLHHRIGVDVEKIDKEYSEEVAKRFFSESESTELLALPLTVRKENFYKIWAKKEALIKATGLGMRLPLESFTVSMNKAIEEVTLQHEIWQLHYLQLDTAYQAAFATEQKVREIVIREWL